MKPSQPIQQSLKGIFDGLRAEIRILRALGSRIGQIAAPDGVQDRDRNDFLAFGKNSAEFGEIGGKLAESLFDPRIPRGIMGRIVPASIAPFRIRDEMRAKKVDSIDHHRFRVSLCLQGREIPSCRRVSFRQNALLAQLSGNGPHLLWRQNTGDVPR